jgi:hypothetical protein
MNEQEAIIFEHVFMEILELKEYGIESCSVAKLRESMPLIKLFSIEPALFEEIFEEIARKTALYLNFNLEENDERGTGQEGA